MLWLSRLALRTRLLVVLSALIFIAVSVGLTAVWYTYNIQSILSRTIQPNARLYVAAEELSDVLAGQRGYVSYFFIDGDTLWLEDLRQCRLAFDSLYIIVWEADTDSIGRSKLVVLDREYRRYVAGKDSVIAFYKAGYRENGRVLHQSVKRDYVRVQELCDDYQRFHLGRFNETVVTAGGDASRYRVTVLVAIGFACLLGILVYVLVRFEILAPIQRLTAEAGILTATKPMSNEVDTLGHRVRGLIDDVDQTQNALKQSRAKLLESEKLAAVGQLAAEVAHSIRSPMTSIEMRVYSLNQESDLGASQREDLAAISDDLDYLDNIIRNFLEYSRPPRLRREVINLSELVDSSLTLLEHKLSRAKVTVERSTRRYDIRATVDRELVKDVLVNIISNAAESMEGGGRLVIEECVRADERCGETAVIDITDAGPGLTGPEREHIFMPFFTTKENGTGLGLPIAARIVREHGGFIDVISTPGCGTTFSVVLPVTDQAGG